MSEGGEGSSSGFRRPTSVRIVPREFITPVAEPTTKRQLIGDATPSPLTLGRGNARGEGSLTPVSTLGPANSTPTRTPSRSSSQEFSRLIHADAFKVLVDYLVGLGPNGIMAKYGGKSKAEGEVLMKAEYKSKIFDMMVRHPHYCELTLNNDIGKFLENKVHDFMYNMSMHIMNHYPTPKEGEIAVEPDTGPIIRLCATYLKRITTGWAAHRSRLPKYVQNQFELYFAKQGGRALLFIERHHQII